MPFGHGLRDMMDSIIAERVMHLGRFSAFVFVNEDWHGVLG